MSCLICVYVCLCVTAMRAFSNGSAGMKLKWIWYQINVLTFNWFNSRFDSNSSRIWTRNRLWPELRVVSSSNSLPPARGITKDIGPTFNRSKLISVYELSTRDETRRERTAQLTQLAPFHPHPHFHFPFHLQLQTPFPIRGWFPQLCINLILNASS